jgi:predicted nucleic acid-binding protein
VGRRAILDTSVLITGEDEAAPAPPRGIDELAVSVVTLAELELGVLRRTIDPDIRARRLATLSYVRETYEALDVDGRVAHQFARIAATLRDTRRAVRVNDAWIAATALAHDAALVTLDRDFEPIPGLEVVMVPGGQGS